jgi:hypothetical protein
VVVDPRAGHGPGIGGFKADSELGVAMRAGHPCYFVGFTPDPMPGQTIEDIMHAEAVFLEKVNELHRDAEGKPCVIGNCQAGWAVMMVAATRPELFGPLIIPGSPLVLLGRGGRREPDALHRRPVRRQLADRAHQRSRARQVRRRLSGRATSRTSIPPTPTGPRTTTSGRKWIPRASAFWNSRPGGAGHVNLNAEEMQWIVDQLFIGNRLATAEIVTSDGVRIDLRNIRSPIICFCSKGDNITPPQQALGWIVDLYAQEDEDLLACGPNDRLRHPRKHRPSRHLRLRRGGQEGASGVRLQHRSDRRAAARSVRSGDDPQDRRRRQSRTDQRRLDRRASNRAPWTIIRAIVQPSLENERRFAAARRVSEINLGLYRTLFQPFVQAFANSAERPNGSTNSILPNCPSNCSRTATR